MEDEWFWLPNPMEESEQERQQIINRVMRQWEQENHQNIDSEPYYYDQNPLAEQSTGFSEESLDISEDICSQVRKRHFSEPRKIIYFNSRSRGHKLLKAIDPTASLEKKKYQIKAAKARSAKNVISSAKNNYINNLIESFKIICLVNNIHYPGKANELSKIVSEYRESQTIADIYVVKNTVDMINTEATVEIQNDEELDVSFKGAKVLDDLKCLEKTNPNGRRFNMNMIYLSFILFNLSPSVYEVLRSIGIPFPVRNTINKYANPKISTIIQEISNPKELDSLIKYYKRENKIESEIHTNLAIDAMSIEATFIASPTSKAINSTVDKDQLKNIQRSAAILIDNSPFEEIVEEKDDVIQEKLDEIIRTLPSDDESDTDYKPMGKIKTSKIPMQSRSKTEITPQLEKDLIDEYVEEIISTELSDDSDYEESPSENPIKYVFAILMLPFDPKLPKQVLRIIGSESSVITNEIMETMKDMIEVLRKNEIYADFISSDGDRGFDIEHRAVFDRYEKMLDQPFLSLVEIVGQFKLWALSDFLHLLKIACSRLKKKPIVVTIIEGAIVTTKDVTIINEFLKIGEPLLDQSSAGKLKDSYPISLFTVANVGKLIECQDIEDALYILPYSLLLEALRNQIWDINTRLTMFNISFEIFSYCYINQYQDFEFPDNVKENNKQACSFLSFSTKINIIRMLNTILGVSHTILEYDFVSLERLATHLVECFFGNVRVNSCFKETYSDIINIIAKGILSSDFKNKLGLKTVKRTRLDNAGVKIGYIDGSVHLDYSENIVQSFLQVYKTLQMNEEVSFFIINILNECKTHEKLLPKCYMQGSRAGTSIIARYKDSSSQQ